MVLAYDAFITYRGGPDATEANALCEILERYDLKAAIDSRDFSPNATFLDEMARCVRESRYTIALISQRYATSHFTQEEAIMQKILDNNEKKRRLIVAYLEDVEAPLWMQSLVGVHLHRDKNDRSFPELKRLLRLLLIKECEPTPEIIQEVDRRIELNWKSLPDRLMKYGLYGFAAYGVLSMISAPEIGEISAEAASDLADDHVNNIDNEDRHGLVRGAARTIKTLFDDLF